MIKRWDDISKVPISLRNTYKLYSMIILGIPCILLEIIDKAPGVDSIRKHIKRIEEITNDQIVLYYKDITRYRRKSLVENKIPFVIEDGQIYLPFLGLHFKKTNESVEEETKEFTPSAQTAYLHFLYNKETVVNTTDFSRMLGWSKMTASRALNELYNAKLLTYKMGGKTGRSKYYKRIADSDYFKKGSELLNSPIKKVVYLKMEPKNSLTAGLEALTKLSMINPSGYKIRAIYRDNLMGSDLKIIKNKDIVKDEKLVELQIWGYDPQLFAKEGNVDIVSLYASLKEDKDERVERALDEVLQGEKWYTD
jgi:predicted transcriptional regulator